MKKLSIISSLIVLILLTAYTPVAQNTDQIIPKEKIEKNLLTDEIEYWALIFGVGQYYMHPEQNRPTMLEMVDLFPSVLLRSNNWKSDHIHTLKGSQATGSNLIKEIFWLIKNTDENDIVLIYITTHGSKLQLNGKPLDLPPIDEADHADEILIMYHGFQYLFSFISDDTLNFLVSLIKSNNICLIIDSCYSGGFNDPPFFKSIIPNNHLSSNNYNSEMFVKGFTEDISSQGRVVLMSCTEDTLSWGNIFSIYLLSSLYYNIADMYGDNNGINSAEEAFYYTDEMVNIIGGQDPTILDLYPGQFTLTYT